VDACTVGAEALRVRRNNKVHVRPEGCTGCGFCENVCPVEPSAIKVYLPEDASAG
jgi:NAD-dependent dihydropyrimidine dehydrogenase PreA subunit